MISYLKIIIIIIIIIIKINERINIKNENIWYIFFKLF